MQEVQTSDASYILKVVAEHSLAAALTDMVPVRARRQIVYPVEKLGINAPSERILQKKQAYALNHINRKLTLEPKVPTGMFVATIWSFHVSCSSGQG